MDIENFAQATGGHKEVPDNYVSGTSLRALIQEDPALLWLKYHGSKHGLEEDPKEYSFLEWIGDKGRAFEAAWIKNVCPEAVQAMDEDVDVRRVQGLTRTLALMARKVPVITKAALWWAPEKIYGSADLIVLTSWLYAKFPQTRPAQAASEPDHYVVLDCKFTTDLDTNDKATDLACNTAQMRIYSYMLGQLQAHMPRSAYLVTRDRPFDPLPVQVEHSLHAPLHPSLAQQRDLHVHIKHQGHQYTPWTHQVVACNFKNKHDEPWHQAKKRIADYLRPLEWLPHIRRSHVAELNRSGLTCLDQVLAMHPNSMDWEALHGIGKTTADRIRAALEANRSGKPSAVSAALVPQRAANEFFCDFEYLSNVNVDFEGDFPEMKGREMVFMVGVGWEHLGRWRYRQFVAARETPEAERVMFEEFVAFLEQAGALKPSGGAVLYHWSGAEVWQSAKAAERLEIPRLAALPWYDLQQPFHAGPIALPDCWSFGLKPVAKALGQISRDHCVEWPESLADGLSASVMGWRMYEQPEPLKTPELGMLSQYLEIDCKAMWAVLSWMRAVAVEDAPVWDRPTAGKGKRKEKGSTPKRSTPRKPRRQTNKKRSRRRASDIGWYRGIVTAADDLPEALGIRQASAYPTVGNVMTLMRSQGEES